MIEPLEGGRGSAATGEPPGMVALARSEVIPYAPFMCRCMGSRAPCCATTAAPLAGICLWSSCVLLLCQDLLWGWAIPIPTGRAPIVRHPLQPWSCATLGAGMQRGMVHREQVRCRCQRLLRGHRAQDARLGTSGVSVDLSGTRRCRVRWPPSTAGVHPHETPAWRPEWDGLAANKRLVSPSPRAPRPADPPLRRLSS